MNSLGSLGSVRRSAIFHQPRKLRVIEIAAVERGKWSIIATATQIHRGYPTTKCSRRFRHLGAVTKCSPKRLYGVVDDVFRIRGIAYRAPALVFGSTGFYRAWVLRGGNLRLFLA